MTNADCMGKAVKFKEPGSSTWEFAKVIRGPETFNDNTYGYLANREVTGTAHQNVSFTDEKFANGLVVQLASNSEVRGKRWSYE